ncbi:MAG: MFS transporter [Clostridia bacterium]|nr:MFS transporter [Clostridia bacterium]
MNQKAKQLFSNVKTYWRTPMPRRYMTFKEIAAYSFGGIGAYFLIQLGSTLIVSTTNTIVSTAIGIGPKDVYIIYLLSTLLNIPLTGVRANMVDNTRGKGGKYRPYLLSMGIPTAVIALVYVWFPYDKMYELFQGQFLGHEKGYIIKCAVVFLCNILLHFFFFFFQDAYTNLIHVLSPNTQERTDVLAVKSVVYSLAPSIMNIVNPIIAQLVANNDLTDIRVYKITYPIFAVIGIALTIVVWANTQEKIVQAKTHTVQVRFMDALREVAKNKYFWIISLAGWLGFLEMAYGNILLYSQSYGKTANGAQMALIYTLVGNASLWGMLLAPLCIRRFGKKKVLIGVNLMNVACIFMMLVDMRNIWWLFVCIYINYLFGAFEQITSPAIQADIRDYQQYRSGERIDGMFAAVATIGSVVTLATSAVLPAVQEKFGIFEGNGYKNPFDILDIETGDPNLLYKFMPALIIMAGIGAFLNVVPYFFYDFTEKKQQGIVRVLKVRALFEDFGNGMLDDGKLVEAIDIIRNAKEMCTQSPKSTSKSDYPNRKALRKAKEYNDDIDISKFVMDELNKYDTVLMQKQVEVYSSIYRNGLEGLKAIDVGLAAADLKKAKSMPKNTAEEKELRSFLKTVSRRKITSKKAIDKYYRSESFVEPDYTVLEKYFDVEDDCELKLKSLYLETKAAKKEHDSQKAASLKSEMQKYKAELKNAQAMQKKEMDKHAYFGRAAKLYIDAKRTVEQCENYKHLDEIEALYDEAKLRYEAKLNADAEEAERLRAEEREMTEKIKAQKAQEKAAKKKK